MGFPVATFGSAAEFLAAERPACPSCLVLDLKLPGSSGLELQRQRVNGCAPPMVFISGHGDFSVFCAGHQGGFRRILVRTVFGEEERLRATAIALLHVQDAQLRQAVIT
jgi:DNA-binding response OmpR family regulator